MVCKSSLAPKIKKTSTHKLVINNLAYDMILAYSWVAKIANELSGITEKCFYELLFNHKSTHIEDFRKG